MKTLIKEKLIRDLINHDLIYGIGVAAIDQFVMLIDPERESMLRDFFNKHYPNLNLIKLTETRFSVDF